MGHSGYKPKRKEKPKKKKLNKYGPAIALTVTPEPRFLSRIICKSKALLGKGWGNHVA